MFGSDGSFEWKVVLNAEGHFILGNGDGEGEFMYRVSRSIEKVLGVKGIERMFQA